MTDEDLFEDGGGKNPRAILRLHSLTVAPQHPEIAYHPLAQRHSVVRSFAWQRSIDSSQPHPASRSLQPISPLKKDQRGRAAIQQQARLAIGLHRHRYHGLKIFDAAQGKLPVLSRAGLLLEQ